MNLFSEPVLLVFDQGAKLGVDVLVDHVKSLVEDLLARSGDMKIERGILLCCPASVGVPGALGADRRPSRIVNLKEPYGSSIVLLGAKHTSC